MIQRCAEVLPKRRVRAGVVGGKEQTKHENQAEKACRPHKNSRDQREADAKLSVCDEECDWRGVRQDETLQHWLHERVSSVFDEVVNPVLKTAVQGELRAEDFVFGKNHKKDADADSQNR